MPAPYCLLRDWYLMRLFDRYILSEMLLPFLCGVGAVVMMLVGNTLFQLVDMILKNHIPLVLVAREILYNLPALVVLTFPIGVALSSSLAINRMARDSEITAVRMAGVSLRRIFLPIFMVGLVASVSSFFISERVVPWSQREKAKTESLMFGMALSASPTMASNRVFVYQNYEFYVGDAAQDPKLPKRTLSLQHVTIYQNPRFGTGFPSIITAQRATYRDGVWTLFDTIVHNLDSDGFTSTEARSPVSTLDLRVQLPMPTDSGGQAPNPDSYTMAELGSRIKVMDQSGLDARELLVAYYFKVSLPFLCFAFALCAPPLSLKFSRTGSFMGVFLSIVMVFVAWNTLLLAKSLGVTGYASPLLAAWSPDIVFAAVGLILLKKAE